MKRKIFQIVFLALLANLLALPAHAVVMIYNTRAAFDAAVGVLPVEDFEGGLVTVGNTVFCGPVLSSSTNNACFQPGDIMVGLSIGSGFGMASINQALGVPSTVVGPALFFDDTDLMLTMAGINAIGFDIYTPLHAGQISMELHDTGGLIDTTVLNVVAGGSVFYGATNTNLTQIIFNDMGVDIGELIDDVAFGAASDPIPEPSTMLLLGSGLAGLAFFRRRRKDRNNPINT